jgi:hypothetical protein
MNQGGGGRTCAQDPPGARPGPAPALSRNRPDLRPERVDGFRLWGELRPVAGAEIRLKTPSPPY